MCRTTTNSIKRCKKQFEIINALENLKKLMPNSDDRCDKDGFTETDIDFKTYRECFSNNSPNIECIRKKIKGGNPDKKIEKIKTEQKFIKHDTIMYYYTGMHENNKPITIEYDSGNYYIIDGIRHHRFNFRKDVLVREGFDNNKSEHEIMLERKKKIVYEKYFSEEEYMFGLKNIYLYFFLMLILFK